MGRAAGRLGVGCRSTGCADRLGSAARLSDGRRPRRAAAIEIVIGGQDVPRTGDRYMQARRLLVIATLTLGLLMNQPSAATSPAYRGTSHVGMSRNALERAYIETYEQSGFRLASRKEYSNRSGFWSTVLEFQLSSVPKGPNAPGSTLVISGYEPGCPCEVSRETVRGLDADNPDPKARLRGFGVVIKAETAALRKVKERLGVSLPEMGIPTP